MLQFSGVRFQLVLLTVRRSFARFRGTSEDCGAGVGFGGSKVHLLDFTPSPAGHRGPSSIRRRSNWNWRFIGSPAFVCSSTMSDTEDKPTTGGGGGADVMEVEEVPKSAPGGAEVVEVEEEEEVAVVSTISGAAGGGISIAEVEIELTEDLKGKLVSDLSSICSVNAVSAREMLQAHKWNMQRAIDSFFDASDSEDENNASSDSVTVVSEGAKSSTPAGREVQGQSDPVVVTLDDVTSPEADSKKEKETEIEKTGSNKQARESFSSWAPEKFSIISWNLDGLDDKNLEKRTDAVIETVLRENHDVLFFQELLPHTFEYISRRICSKYMPIPGTEDPSCDYLTGTFLKLNQVHYEEHYIVPFPNTAMQRNLLVTKAFIGQAKIAFLNTHLESTAEFSAQRTEQLKMCFEIAKSFPPEYNVMFGGDLNLRDAEVGGSIPDGMCDLWVRCGSRATCKFTWDLTRNTNKQMPSKYQPRCRFDRIYFRPSRPSTLNPEFFGVTGLEKAFGTQSFPSDHWGIISFFRLSKEARKPTAKKRKLEN